MNRSYSNKTQGFTLVELLVVMLVLVALSSITLDFTKDFAFQGRYEVTKDRYDKIKRAIIGRPDVLINGQPDISGFVADMGRLPINIRELIAPNGYCQNGSDWNNKADCEDAGKGNSNWITLCSNSSYTTQNTCELNAGTWAGWKAYGFCSDTSHTDESNCIAASKNWLPIFWGGSRAPYINITNDVYEVNAFSDGWGNTSDLVDYGWDYCLGNAPDFITCTGSKKLAFRSLGKNHSTGGAGYDKDYPVVQPAIQEEDWTVNISSGLSASFIKPLSSSIPIDSFCSDPSKFSKSTCEAINLDTTVSYGEWFGGCSSVGYINQDTCVAGGEKWYSCNVNTKDNNDAGYPTCTSPDCYKTKTDCLNVDGTWFGEGYGCDNVLKSDKATCEAADVWRSCSDDGTITGSAACNLADELWYGDVIVNRSFSSISVKKYQDKKICMKVFFRENNSTLNFYSSNEILIREDGSYQTISFPFPGVTNIPMGLNAVGVYEYDGAGCATSTVLYPNNRTQPVPIQLTSHVNLSVINW